tara:strand:+ start:21418 stop:21606 length:189 start_codon:yes stop_codon:yes gene_type:complete
MIFRRMVEIALVGFLTMSEGASTGALTAARRVEVNFISRGERLCRLPRARAVDWVYGRTHEH